MIKYLTYEEIDKQRWDECIYNSFNGIVYAYSWYLDIVCPSWEALVENDYERVFPLTGRKKTGINYLYQPCFSQQLGVFSRNILSEEIIENFIKAIPSKYKFVEINFNTFNKLNSEKFNITRNLTHELDLISSYENLYHNYSENTKRNLKLANNSLLTQSTLTNADVIINLFRLNKGKEIKTLNEKDYLLLKKIVSSGIRKNILQIRTVKNKDEQLCAGAIFIESNRKVIFLFSAINDEAKTNGAMFFLIDSFIKENSQHNLTLDFEGSNNPNLARFYKSFGAKECIYYHYKKNDLAWIFTKSITFIKWLRNKIK